MNKSILLTIKKEIRSVFRDKKTLRNIFIIPFLIPVMIFLYGYMFDNADNIEKSYDIGINYEPSDYEKESFNNLKLKYVIINDKDELDREYKNKKIDAYIIYSSDNNKYTIYCDETEDGLQVSSVLDSHFEKYNQYLINEKLIDMKIDVEKVFNNFDLEYVNIDKSKGYFIELIFSMVIMYVIFSISAATSSMSNSITASERENGTLETILTFPIKPKELIMGKYLSSVIVGIISSLFGLIVGLVSISISKKMFNTLNDITLNFNIIILLISIIIIILASLFISSVALILTIYSKNTKESQSATQTLNFICIIPLFIKMINIDVSSYYYIPILNYNEVLMNIYTNSINWVNIIITIISTIVLICLVLKYIFTTYSSEKVLFTD